MRNVPTYITGSIHQYIFSLKCHVDDKICSISSFMTGASFRIWKHKVKGIILHVLYITVHPPQSLFFILPFFWPPRPKPDFLISESHCLFLVRSFFMPPPCKNFCFCSFLRCFKIWSLLLSSERTLRPPGDCCGTAGLWELKLRPPRPRPRPRPPPGTQRCIKENSYSKELSKGWKQPKLQ